MLTIATNLILIMSLVNILSIINATIILFINILFLLIIIIILLHHFFLVIIVITIRVYRYSLKWYISANIWHISNPYIPVVLLAPIFFPSDSSISLHFEATIN